MCSRHEFDTYLYLLKDIDLDKKKQNNVRTHLKKKYNENESNDSQLSLFKLLIQKEKIINSDKRAEELQYEIGILKDKIQKQAKEIEQQEIEIETDPLQSDHVYVGVVVKDNFIKTKIKSIISKLKKKKHID